jgi:hypothetical protein
LELAGSLGSDKLENLLGMAQVFERMLIPVTQSRLGRQSISDLTADGAASKIAGGSIEPVER